MSAIIAQASWTRKDELAKLRDTLHPKELNTCNRNTVQVTISITPYRRALVRFHLRDNYPEKPAIVELDAPMLAPGVTKKLLKACESRISLCASSGDMQVFNTVTFLKKVMNENKLLPCVDEVKKQTKQASTVCTNVAMSEKTGLVRLDFQNGKYAITMDLKIPDDYPAAQPVIKFRKSTFPKIITEVYHAQASEVARRLMLGYTEEQALRASDGLKRPPQKKRVKDPLSKVRVTTEKLSQLKNDVKVLKQMGELRKESQINKQRANQFKQQRNKRALNESHETARRARRELRRLAGPLEDRLQTRCSAGQLPTSIGGVLLLT